MTKPLLSTDQIRSLYRLKYPDGLVCDLCGALIASAGYALRAYTCAECRSDASEADKVSAQRLKSLSLTGAVKPPRGRALVVVAKAEPQPHDEESLVLIRAAHYLETAPAPRKPIRLTDAEVVDLEAPWGLVAEGPKRGPERSKRRGIAILSKTALRRVGTEKSPVLMLVPEGSKSNGRVRNRVKDAQGSRQRRITAKETLREQARQQAQRQRDYQRAYRARLKADQKAVA